MPNVWGRHGLRTVKNGDKAGSQFLGALRVSEMPCYPKRYLTCQSRGSKHAGMMVRPNHSLEATLHGLALGPRGRLLRAPAHFALEFVV